MQEWCRGSGSVSGEGGSGVGCVGGGSVSRAGAGSVGNGVRIGGLNSAGRNLFPDDLCTEDSTHSGVHTVASHSTATPAYPHSTTHLTTHNTIKGRKTGHSVSEVLPVDSVTLLTSDIQAISTADVNTNGNSRALHTTTNNTIDAQMSTQVTAEELQRQKEESFL